MAFNKTMAACVVSMTLGVMPLITAHAQEQGNSAPAVKRVRPSWQEIASWPDFYTGMWEQQMAMAPGAGGFAPPPQPVYTAKAQAYLASHRGGGFGGSGSGCSPPGMPGQMGQGYAIGFYYAQNAIFAMTDMDSLWLRRIFMDRTEHGDPDPTAAGNSIGHWEGKTLVADTTAISGEMLYNVPANGKTHITERFELSSPNKLSYTQIIENPDVLAKPMIVHATYVRKPNWEIQDAWCGEDVRSTEESNGQTKFNLVPPAP